MIRENANTLANKLHRRLYGTDYVRAEKKIAEQISIKYDLLTKLSPLSDLRNRNALRLPKGSAEKVLKHQNCQALILYLELKGLIISSVVFSDKGKFPYDRIAELTGESNSNTRKHITTLVELGLIIKQPDKSFLLSRFAIFRNLIKSNCKRTHKLINNGDTKKVLRHIALSENLARQEYIRKKKIFEREIIAQKTVSTTELLYLTSKCEKAIGCGLGKTGKELQQNLRLSRRAIRKFRKYFDSDFDYYKRKYEKIYNTQIQQIDFGMPKINPNVTLSCKGTARVCGLTSKSSGHLIQAQLKRAKQLRTVSDYIQIPEQSPAIFESNVMGLRADIFGYRYNTRGDGNKKLYFRRACNKLFLNDKAIKHTKSD